MTLPPSGCVSVATKSLLALASPKYSPKKNAPAKSGVTLVKFGATLSILNELFVSRASLVQHAGSVAVLLGPG